ncbi:hypothetical protein DFH09DRAFT_1265673 [Mycena vulgaris]|nr:hypothetical protein DFH09DRAFT_1265673 [Mycena vulgaris]
MSLSMIRLFALASVTLFASAAVIPRGNQFTTGPCASDSDCAEGCCGFTTGKCAGPVIALTRDGGCGFGSGGPNANAAIALGQFPDAVNAFIISHPGIGGVPVGTQFVTAPCTSDADCAEGCCGFNTGRCAGPVIALTRDGGCGFGSVPNANAAMALGQFPDAVAAFMAAHP